MSKSSYFFVGIYLHKRTVLKTLKVLRPPPVCIVNRFHWDKYRNVFQKNRIFFRILNYPITETPISLPIAKVIAAAKRPKMTCLIPENQTLFPVNSVIAEPIRNKPTALNPALKTIAFVPLQKKNGITGMIAPTAKRKNDAKAASIADPFNSSTFIPNSSCTRNWCAEDLSLII